MPRTLVRKPPRTAAVELARTFTGTGLSMAEAARRTGVSRALFGEYLAGRRVPSYDRMTSILYALGEFVRPSVAFHAHQAEVRDLLDQAGISSAIVFGSAAAGTDVPGSDLDLLVESRTGHEPDLLTLAEEIEELLGVPVDLLSHDLATPEFVERVLSLPIEIV